jgi:hypothetical protein
MVWCVGVDHTDVKVSHAIYYCGSLLQRGLGLVSKTDWILVIFQPATKYEYD